MVLIPWAFGRAQGIFLLDHNYRYNDNTSTYFVGCIRHRWRLTAWSARSFLDLGLCGSTNHSRLRKMTDEYEKFLTKWEPRLSMPLEFSSAYIAHALHTPTVEELYGGEGMILTRDQLLELTKLLAEFRLITIGEELSLEQQDHYMELAMTARKSIIAELLSAPDTILHTRREGDKKKCEVLHTHSIATDLLQYPRMRFLINMLQYNSSLHDIDEDRKKLKHVYSCWCARKHWTWFHLQYYARWNMSNAVSIIDASIVREKHPELLAPIYPDPNLDHYYGSKHRTNL